MLKRTPAHVSRVSKGPFSMENDRQCVEGLLELAEHMGIILGATLAQEGDIDMGLLREAIDFGFTFTDRTCPLITPEHRDASQRFIGVLHTLEDMYTPPEGTGHGRFRPDEQQRLFREWNMYSKIILDSLGL